MTQLQQLQMLMITILFQLCSIMPCYAEYRLHAGTEILYVTPTTNVPCPGSPCLTLSLYSWDQQTYFSTYTELRFLSGIHRLTKQIVVEEGSNVSSLSLVGEGPGQSTIIVSGEAGFKLTGINDTRVESLHLFGSNALNIANSSSLVMNNVQFTSVNRTVFTFENISNITGTNIILSNSSVSDAYSAGTIRLSDAAFTNTTVVNNSGNSITTIEQSNVWFKKVSIFVNNIANKGSALTIDASSVTFEGFTLFHSNSCKDKGGAMNIIHSTIALSGRVELSYNTAKDGGAIQLDQSVLVLQGIIDVSHNSVTKSTFHGQVFGGAINSFKSNITMNIIAITFSKNHIEALFLRSFGGAISAQMSTLTMSGIIGFHHNYAKSFLSYGGAIFLCN